MTLRVKKRLVGSLLLVLALWPAAHRALAHTYGMNPWKFFGWAMYVTPALPADVGLFKIVDDRLVEIDPGRLPPGREDDLIRFLMWRKYAGSMVRPDRYARAIFEVRPDLDTIAIVMTDRVLNPKTAKVEVRRYGYRYHRDPTSPEDRGPRDRP